MNRRDKKSFDDHKTYANKFTNTPPSMLICPKCQQSNTISKSTLLDYVKSINYINSCHSLINQLLLQKSSTSPPKIIMPDFPNFLNILNELNQNFLAELDSIDSVDEVFLHCDDMDNQPPKSCVQPQSSCEERPSCARVRSNDKQKKLSNIPILIDRTRGPSPHRKSQSQTAINKPKKNYTVLARPVTRSDDRRKPLASRQASEMEMRLAPNTKSYCSLLKSAISAQPVNAAEPKPSEVIVQNLHTKQAINNKATCLKQQRKVTKDSLRKMIKAKKRVVINCEWYDGEPPAKPAKKFEDSDIEPDTYLASTDNLLKNLPECEALMTDEFIERCSSTKSEEDKKKLLYIQSQYHVLNEPVEDFLQESNKATDGDSEIESDKDHYQPSESDVDEMVFENSPRLGKDLAKEEEALKNIGFLTHFGKVKPEKQHELEKIKSERSQDKHNSLFRQPRRHSDVMA